MTSPGYEWYCNKCRARGIEPPTFEWWQRACAQVDRPRWRSLDQEEIDSERREGWAYGY